MSRRGRRSRRAGSVFFFFFFFLGALFSVTVGIVDTVVQGEWEDLNRKANTMFAALQTNNADQDDDSDGDDDDDGAGGNAMTDDGPAKKPVVLQPYVPGRSDHNLVAGGYGDLSDDQIT